MKSSTTKLAFALALPALLLFTTHCSDADPRAEDDGNLASGGSGTSVAAGMGTSNGGSGGAAGVGGGGEGGSGGVIQSSVLTLVHDVSGQDTVDSMHAAMAPDGTIYVLLTDNTAQGIKLKMTRSTDGGLTFENPTPIDTGAIELNTWEETQPKLGASNNRVALAFTNKTASNIWVTYSDTAGGLSFTNPVAVGAGGINPKNQFPAVAIGTNDEVWVTWARGEAPAGGALTVLRMYAARQSEGFATTMITDETSGRPCVCCGVEMIGLTTGEMLVVFRGWDAPRNQFVVTHPGTASGTWTTVQASTTNWNFMGCPENGSGIAEIPGGGVRMAWTDPTGGASNVWLIDSDDAGMTWYDQRLASDPFPGGHPGPMLAIEPGGRNWLGWAPPFNGTASVVHSNDGGQNFTGLQVLNVPDGELKRPALVSGTSGSFAIGVVDNQAIWLASLEEM